MIFKILGNSSEVFGNLRKFSKNFGNGSKVIFRCFYDFLKFSENLRKFSENFGNGSKVIFRIRCFYDFLEFFKIYENSNKSLQCYRDRGQNLARSRIR